MDCLDAVDGEDVTGRRAAEFISAVTGADSDGERVHLRGLNKSGRLVRIGQQL